jgi:hypothetical protein
VTAEQVRQEKGKSEPADNYIFFYGNGKNNHHLQAAVSDQQLRGKNLLVIGCHI